MKNQQPSGTQCIISGDRQVHWQEVTPTIGVLTTMLCDDDDDDDDGKTTLMSASSLSMFFPLPSIFSM